tara:strand:- start:5453 stop:5965 length:513 start_codon:yes stop_codon:yes gene_type:complete
VAVTASSVFREPVKRAALTSANAPKGKSVSTTNVVPAKTHRNALEEISASMVRAHNNNARVWQTVPTNKLASKDNVKHAREPVIAVKPAMFATMGNATLALRTLKLEIQPPNAGPTTHTPKIALGTENQKQDMSSQTETVDTGLSRQVQVIPLPCIVRWMTSTVVDGHSF